MRNIWRFTGILFSSALIASIAACGGGGSSNNNPPPPTTYTLTVNSAAPASGVLIGYTENGSTAMVQGTTPFTITADSGTAIALSAPSTAGGNNFSAWTGCTSSSTETCSVTLNSNTTATATYSAPALTTPTVTVTPGAASITTSQSLSVTVALSGTPAPTGTVVLTSGSYTSSTVTLTAGGATINIPAGSLATGTDTLTVKYTPDSGSTSLYNSATGMGSVVVTAPALITPIVTVSPAQTTIAETQSVNINITVSSAGNPTPTGSVVLTAGSYVSASTPLTAGSTVINIPANTLPVGAADSLSAAYTTDVASSTIYNDASGTNTIHVVAAKTTPTVTVTPGSLAVDSNAALSVTIAVTGSNGTPTGSVTLSGGGYTSSATTLASGSATIDIPANSLTAGSDVLTGSYTPDTASSGIYNSATGTSSAVTVTQVSSVTVNQTSTGIAVTNQILGMNLAIWYDDVGNATAINNAFAQAGIKAIRWPGGSTSDDYHWQTPNSTSSPNLPFQCATVTGTTTGALTGGTAWGGYSTFAEFVTSIVQGGSYDLALTANYGEDVTCANPGDPTEAAAWVSAAVTDGIHVSHVTVGNEEYGDWETDLHALPHDATTYASATVTGYYPDIKAADPTTLVGVSVNPGNSPLWDPTVLSNAKGSYDFVEYHYYPQTPGKESDTYLVQQAAQGLTTNIKTIKQELTTAGTPNTPIYVGEMGSVYTNPGKQTMSITQGLYAGQILGEMMNDGVARATWWIGFGNCNGTAGNDSSSLYGWQDFGAYNVFSDGPSDGSCSPWSTIGTMSPTARAYQLFSNVAVTGENVLTASVSGDTTDVRAYAATHSGGTALVLFNDNETASEAVSISLSGGASSSSDVSVITYDKAIYDQTNPANAGGAVWAAPTTTDLGQQNLPLTLTLTPWSMNVIIIK
jgi:hypothetical protein